MQDDTKPRRWASRRASDVDLDALIWEQRGAVEVCKACGFVREGTASATLRHRERCIAVVLYGAALVLQRQGRDDSDFAGDMESLFDAAQVEIGRLRTLAAAWEEAYRAQNAPGGAGKHNAKCERFAAAKAALLALGVEP